MDSIVRALRGIDRRLFLEKQLTFQNDLVWCVVCDIGSGQPPVTLFEWRDPRGEPLPLDSGIVERVQRMERDGERLAQRALDANARMVESQRRQSRDAYVEIARDMIPRIEDRRRPVFPRSQALRMSRDKRRAQGEKI